MIVKPEAGAPRYLANNFRIERGHNTAAADLTDSHIEDQQR